MPLPDYATTRCLVSEKPSCFDTSTDGLLTLLKTPDNKNKIAEGGLRLQGFFKTNSEEKPLITVVTVVYNGAEFLEETIKSVIKQTYDNVEYIIVDGGSTDATLDIIRKYEHAIDYWVSEPDKGIYDAMNKGIDLGNGEWINFMNAGDYFFDACILEQVFEKSAYLQCFDVIYGDHEVRYPNKTKKVKGGDVKNLWKGSQFCHQSAFVRLNNHKVSKFNLYKKVASDYDFFATIKKRKSNFCRVFFMVSSVSSGGVSDLKRNLVYTEWCRSAKKSSLNVEWNINVNYCFLIYFLYVKNLVKRLVSMK